MKTFKVNLEGSDFHWNNGSWVNTRTSMIAPVAIHSRLNIEVVASMTEEAIEKVAWSEERRAELFRLLHKELGASLEHLSRNGFFKEVQELNPAIAIAALYKDLQVSNSLSFQNNERLRDRFFQRLDPVQFDLPVRILGDRPFSGSDFVSFLKSRGVKLAKKKEISHCIVIGRRGWSKAEVDQIVEQSNGSVLRIYSQEMLTAVLAGHPDPFRTIPLAQRLWDLYAFRLGHEGLEYVSHGWSGWYQGYRSVTGGGAGGDSASRGAVEESPLAAMGYRVGASGAGKQERQSVLRRAFHEPLPYVGSDAYMEQWAEPGTGERLRRIAIHLTTLVEKNKQRAELRQAVADWTSDLTWLRDEFYHGVRAFDWPQISTASSRRLSWRSRAGCLK